MELFAKFVTVLAGVPAFVPLLIVPALCVAAVALFGFLGGRKFYPVVGVVLLAVGTALICAYDAGLGGVYFGLLLAWGALWGSLLFLPKLKKREKRRSQRAERLYEKFHMPLEVSVPADEKKPPKVCCFEEAPMTEQTEQAPKLDHADALLKKLASAKLSPSDRLEIDALKRKLDLYRNRPVTKEEQRSLNDCLSTVLKLTAKYKL